MVAHTIIYLLLFTHSHDPCQWGESDLSTYGPPASFFVHLASSAGTLTGSTVPKSSGDNMVCMWVQLKRFMYVSVTKGHSGDGCDLKKVDLFVRSWARLRRVRQGRFYVCCSDCVGVRGNVCYVVAIVKDSVLALEY